MLMKDLPVKPGLTEAYRPPSAPSISHGQGKDVFCQQVNNALTPAPAGKPKMSPKWVIDKYKRGETHAVSLLHQLAQILQFHLEMKETVTTGNVTRLYFAFCAVIDGVEYKTGMGITKKDARQKAAELALQDLLPTLEGPTSVLPEASDAPPPLPVKEGPSISEVYPCRVNRERKNFGNLQILHAVRNQLFKLMNNHLEFSAQAGTTAAFILQTSSGCEVVALGTGNFNIKESCSAESSGRTVLDSHAVVTARRSLMRFLYRHLLMFYSKTANLTEKSIFQQSSDGSSSFLSLKGSITLHLYVNQLPKGAAQIPSRLNLNPLSISAWQVNNEMSLHLSVEGKVFSVFSSAYDQSASRVVSMSATDKISQWQVLGYQGALLSHFIEPIYVDSILVGDSCCSDTRGMEMSVSQRAEGITSQLPVYYCMIRPRISLVSSVATNSADGGQLTHGINWSEGDSSLEVVDGLQGKTIEESPFKSGSALASRLCKAAMLHRFKMVAKEAQRPDLLAATSYREAKGMAKAYQEAKRVLRAYLLQQGFGLWLVKPSVGEFSN
ncbi:putative adenosine deaminase domain-containing protein 1 [Scophthalmus maximus]|uniref:Adenosine deaminase domain-containing protein 1 n=1 Tax=Scophthalmus maximus TaxID=52904 RepID=A0A2U9C531_SCOMX|nr:putative adenosine deaminase domain-containing protein 1 [Scophthalmus maximus]